MDGRIYPRSKLKFVVIYDQRRRLDLAFHTRLYLEAGSDWLADRLALRPSVAHLDLTFLQIKFFWEIATCSKKRNFHIFADVFIID